MKKFKITAYCLAPCEELVDADNETDAIDVFLEAMSMMTPELRTRVQKVYITEVTDE